MAIGTVITTGDGPSVGGFCFVLDEPVKKGEFVAVKTEEGTIIASIEEILKTNRYFESAGAVKEISGDMFTAFPIKEWEYTIARARTLGVYSENNMLNRPSFPPSPGNKVNQVELAMLNRFLGLDQENGLEIGNVQQHELKAKFNLTKMFQKHMAVLAISGAGKSYTMAVMLEELLSRKSEQGRIAMLAIDPHGEYTCLKENNLFGPQVSIVKAEDVKISVRSMSEKAFAALLPKMSAAQVRDLGKVIDAVRKEKELYDLKDLMEYIQTHDDIGKSTVNALLGWLSSLDAMKVFGESDYPNVETMLEQGKLTVIDLSNILSQQKKQLIVEYLSRKLFDLRRAGKVPPYLEIIEEAHNFCPDAAAEKALSKPIIETLAREGRKFYANICLISQRPVQLSTTALSQCNTQMILRITNPYDLDHIKKSAEAITSSTLGMLSSLKVGEALIVGEATNYPVFVKVRERKSEEGHGEKLEDYAKKYEGKDNKLASAGDFM